MARQVVYDLTEVLLVSTAKLRYYGIAKTVTELASELVKIYPEIRFCVHSPAHDAFYEVKPQLIADGTVNLNVPSGFRPLRVRRNFYQHNFFRDLFVPIVRSAAFFYNRLIWKKNAKNLPEIDMSDKILLSCSRPKLIVEAIESLKIRYKNWEIIPYLYDLIPLHDFSMHSNSSFPINFVEDNKTIMRHSKKVFVISEFTRKELFKFGDKVALPSNPDVVAVPLVHECTEGDELSEQDIPSQPYLLTVGSATGRKNLEVVFEALLQLHNAGKPVPTLCLAGALRKRTREYFESERFLPIRDKIVVRHSPNQTDLVSLYRDAIALVIPSYIEGWGLPAGEALWLGTPAICSTAEVLVEVCGDLGLYFDPDEPSELAAHILNLMSDKSFDRDLRSRIAAAKPDLRDWSNVARDIKLELDTYAISLDDAVN